MASAETVEKPSASGNCQENEEAPKKVCCAHGEPCKEAHHDSQPTEEKNAHLVEDLTQRLEDLKQEKVNKRETDEEQEAKNTEKKLRTIQKQLNTMEIGKKPKIPGKAVNESQETSDPDVEDLDAPSKKAFLGIMGWEHAEKIMSDRGKLIGLYYKFEKITNIDMLDDVIPRFVVYKHPGSSEYSHYRILDRDNVFIVENGEGEPEVHHSLDELILHQEKIANGTITP